MAGLILPLYALTATYLGVISHTTAIRQAQVAAQLPLGYSCLGALCLCAFALGGLSERFWRGPVRKPDRFDALRTQGSSGTLLLLLILCWAGYAFFFAGILSGGGIGLALAVLRGGAAATYAIRNTGHLLPGLSSLTQIGPAYAVGLIVAPPRPRRVRRWFLAGGVTVVVLAALRSVLWSERLALIEVVVPAAVAYVVTRGFPDRGWTKGRHLSLAPIPAAVAAVLLFGVLETLRSWPFYFQAYNGDWFGFILDRLGLYYGLALSNGGLLLTQVPRELGHLNFTFDWLYRLPFLQGWGWTMDARLASANYMEQLTAHGNAQFNNESGVFAYIYDFGELLCVPAFAIAGWAAALTYDHARRGRVFANLVYPFIFIAILEILRDPYLTGSRMFYIMLGLVVVGMGVRSPASRPGRPPSSLAELRRVRAQRFRGLLSP